MNVTECISWWNCWFWCGYCCFFQTEMCRYGVLRFNFVALWTKDCQKIVSKIDVADRCILSMYGSKYEMWYFVAVVDLQRITFVMNGTSLILLNSHWSQINLNEMYSSNWIIFLYCMNKRVKHHYHHHHHQPITITNMHVSQLKCNT